MKPGILWSISLVLALSATMASGQSLGEVAQKEEARRKAVKQPSKVYTNADLPSKPGTTPPPSSTTPPPLTPPAPKDGATKAAPEKPKADTETPAPAEPDTSKDPAYWHDRITTARTDVDRTQTYLDALQSRINALTTDFVNRDDPAQRALIESDRRKAVAELDRLKGVLADQVKAVTDIEDEARRKGVPPGWLR
jgi:hypothetical protein